MLSRVLTGQDAEKATPLECPQVAPFFAPPAHSASPGGPRGPEGAEAKATIQRLEAELVTVRRQAVEAGIAEGEKRARAELEPVAARMNAAIAELAGMRAEMRRRAERDVVQLALLIAKRVLHREMSVDENALIALARVAFERLANAESYKVTVHPRFAKAIAGAMPPAIAGKVRIESDPARDPGTFIIDSPEGLIDASIDTQLEEIGRGLADTLARA